MRVQPCGRQLRLLKTVTVWRGPRRARHATCKKLFNWSPGQVQLAAGYLNKELPRLFSQANFNPLALKELVRQLPDQLAQHVSVSSIRAQTSMSPAHRAGPAAARSPSVSSQQQVKEFEALGRAVLKQDNAQIAQLAEARLQTENAAEIPRYQNSAIADQNARYAATSARGAIDAATHSSLAEARASMNSYWSQYADKGVSAASFLRYLTGQAMHTLGNVGYSLADKSVAVYNNPEQSVVGGLKSIVNFGPEAFNGATNVVKTSLNGYSLLAERLGAGEGAFAGFRGTDAYNVAPLLGYGSHAQAGGALFAQAGLGLGLAKYGGYRIAFEDIAATGPGAAQAGAIRIRMTTPDEGASRILAVNRNGTLYPEVPDPRTGRPIPFPDGELARVDMSKRASWDSKADRYAYIREWHDRGYETPRGGWSQYDVHHIQPLEFGGRNNFWNLVPVQRQTHQNEFNMFWSGL